MSQQIQITGGAKVRDLQDVIIGTSGVLSSVAFDVANGVPRLDSNGKILVSQLPNSVMEYKGTWNAATNTPTLANGTGNQGDVYLCNVAGTVDFGAGPISFIVGDSAVYSGSIWQRSGGATGSVTSVGLSTNGGAITIGNSPITTSGVISANFNGTNLQYVNGAGNLTTFPDLTGFVPYTGATSNVNLGVYDLTSRLIKIDGSTNGGSLNIKQNATTIVSGIGYNSISAKSDTSLQLYYGNATTSTFKAVLLNVNNIIDGSTRAFEFPDANGTIALTSDIPSLTGYVPYTGATANVDLGVYDLTADLITGARGSFASNGGSDTFAINHSSGGGIALNITKGGSGEGLYINKTSGSGNAATIVGTLEATTLVKSGGTSSQFLKADGTVDSNTYALDSAVVHNTGNETIGGTKTFSNATKNNGGILLQNGSTSSTTGYMNLGGTLNGFRFTNDLGITNSFNLPSATGYFFTFPNATGTIALTSDLTGGTVTSVAALTIGTSGTDLSSTVANSTTTPVITLNVPTASATNRGALSSADWTTFNNKQSALTNPVTGTGTTNYLPKFTGASTIGNSAISDDGTTVTIAEALKVNSNVTIKPATGYNAYFQQSGTALRINYLNDAFSANVSASYRATDYTWQKGDGSDVLKLDASGNLGLGVTPSAWLSGYPVIQMPQLSIFSGAGGGGFIFGNAYLNTSGSFTYQNSGLGASAYNNQGGAHQWSVAPSGTAGAAITFTQAMTLTASGRLLLGTTTDNGYKLDVNGTGRFSGKLTISNISDVYAEMTTSAVDGDALLGFSNTGDANSSWGIGRRNTGEFWIANYTGNFLSGTRTVPFQIASTGAATFSSSVTVGGSTAQLFLNGSGGYAWIQYQNNGAGDWIHGTNVGGAGQDWNLYNYGTSSSAFKIAKSNNAATFSSSVTATGFFESSDSRLKTLIQDNYQTKGIASITPKLYTKNGKVELGYYAQDFVGILDSAVSKGSDDMLSLSYREVLVAKVYALEQEIKELKAKMN